MVWRVILVGVEPSKEPGDETMAEILADTLITKWAAECNVILATTDFDAFVKLPQNVQEILKAYDGPIHIEGFGKRGE